VLHRPAHSGFHPSVDYRPTAKTDKLFRIFDQSCAQPAAAERYIYHMIPTKNPAQLVGSKHRRQRQVPIKGAELAPPALGSIQSRKQHCRFSGTDGFRHFLETGNRETRPARQSDHFATTPRQ
jgi:hypothetical protein